MDRERLSGQVLKFFIQCNLTPTAVYEYLSEALLVSVDVLNIL